MTAIRRVGVFGGGLIGMSWASLFLARGLDVVVVDPRTEAGDEVRRFVETAWPHLAALDLTVTEKVRYPAFSQDVLQMQGVDFVQENGPDRIAVKQEMIHLLEAAVAADVVIASSTSSLRASAIQAGARHPGRILVAHPMNPPHLVPMVELVAGAETTQTAVATAEAFYLQMDRVPIRVNKEVPGHLANRLTAALYREAVHIAAEGIADVASIDKAIAYGPGMRWALMGPHLTYHLGGGAGGYRRYLDHLGPTHEARWRELGATPLSEAVKALLVEGVEQELATQDADTLVQRRDQALVELIRLKAKFGL